VFTLPRSPPHRPAWSQGPPVDIFSFAVVLWELITLEIPHNNLDRWVVLIRGGMGKLQLVVPDETPEEIKTLLGACWDYNPAARPTAGDLLRTLEGIQKPGGVAHERMLAIIEQRSHWRGAIQKRMLIEAEHQAAEYRRLKNVERRNLQLTVGLAIAVVVITLLAVMIGMQAGDVTAAGRVFAEGNLNNDQVVTLAELRKLGTKGVLKRMGMNIDSDEELSLILERYDAHTPADGGLDKLEFEDLVAGETSWYSMARELFIDYWDIDPSFSLSVHLRDTRDAAPFGELLSGVVGAGILGATLVFPRSWMAREATIEYPGLAVIGTLGFAGIGTFLFSLGTIDVLYSHLGTREMLQFGSVIIALWLAATLLLLVLGFRASEEVPQSTPPVRRQRHDAAEGPCGSGGRF
jgi:hypothetical protein